MNRINENNNDRVFPRRRAVGLALGAGLLAAAALAQSASAATLVPEAMVRERATERWQALLAGKLDVAYRMLVPSYRAVKTEKQYQDSIGGAAVWTGARVTRVVCNEQQDNCTAHVRIDAKPALGPRMGPVVTTYVEETWVRQDGQWWLYQQL